MIVLKTIGYIFGAIFLLSLAMVAYFIVRWVFIDKFSLLGTHFSKDIAWQAPDVELQERAHELPPLTYEYRPGSGDAPSVREMLLTPTGALEEGTRVFDRDPNREVSVLDNHFGGVSTA